MHKRKMGASTKGRVTAANNQTYIIYDRKKVLLKKHLTHGRIVPDIVVLDRRNYCLDNFKVTGGRAVAEYYPAYTYKIVKAKG